jgi:hypothetical protein
MFDLILISSFKVHNFKFCSFSNFSAIKLLPTNECDLRNRRILDKARRVAPYTPTRSCVHIGVLKTKIKSKKKNN